MSRNVGAVARNKTKNSQEAQLCADCGATEAEWASINRGVRVCIDCCSVHRSLGRHVSQIKSCKDKDWHPHTWSLVLALSSGGANSVWEHTLLDPTIAKAAKQKPTLSDPVHPVKADFIRAKHQMLSFVIHPPTSASVPRGSSPSPAAVGCAGGGEEDGGRRNEEGDPSMDGDEGEASQELHSSVRTANLVTSLRLLSQGADPNYYHKARGNYPLHVAVSSGQAEQVELLLVYGAVPQSVDANGNTPAECASIAGHSELAARLTDVQFELVHRLVRYLSDLHTNTLPHSQPYRSCVTRLDATFTLSSSPAVTAPSTRASSTVDSAPSTTISSNNTFSSSSLNSSNGPVALASFFLPPHLINLHQHATDHARQARARLIRMPSVLLEELAADLYDEVDRRELEAVCGNSTVGAGERCTVPFLPVNPLLSSTRNQARQKLARLREAELCSLIVDLLVEARRRAAIVAHPSASAARAARASAVHDAKEDDPLYDSVCSEDDYSLVEQLERFSLQQAALRRDGGTSLDQDYQEVTLPYHPDWDAIFEVKSPVDEQPFSFAPTDAHNNLPQDSLTNNTPAGGGLAQSSSTPGQGVPSVQVTSTTAVADSPTDAAAPSSLVLDSETKSQAVVMPSTLSPSQQHLITSTFVAPPSLSPSVSTINKEAAGGEEDVTAEQYESMRHKLETSERTIRELQDDNQLMKTQLDQLFSTVHHLQESSDASPPFTAQGKVNKLRRENSSLRSIASPSPPPLPSTPSPTIYQMPYQSLPPLHNGDGSPAFNSSSRSFASMPYHHPHQPVPQHYHQRSDSYPTYNDPNTNTNSYNFNTSSSSNSNNPSASIRNFPPPPSLPPPPLPSSNHYDYPLRSPLRPSTHPLLGTSNNNNNTTTLPPPLRAADGNSINSNHHSALGGQSTVAAQRPFSMFEAREQRDMNLAAALRRDGRTTSGATTSNTVSCNTYESICNSSEWEATHPDTTNSCSNNRGQGHSQHQRSSSFSDDLCSGIGGGGGGADSTLSSGRTSVVSRRLTPHLSFPADLPAQSKVVGLTDSITRGIQELLATAQSASPGVGGMEVNHQQFMFCAEKISLAVAEMVSVFPKGSSGQLSHSMHGALVTLAQSAVTLKTQCQHGDPSQSLIQAAYAIAQATRNLVTCFQ